MEVKENIIIYFTRKIAVDYKQHLAEHHKHFASLLTSEMSCLSVSV